MRKSIIFVLVLAAALLGTQSGATLATEEARYCVTVRSEVTLDRDVLSAIVAGEATAVFEDPGACALPSETDGPVPSIGVVAAQLAGLRIASETPTGYDRDRFDHWIDADGDGCHTRNEVLIEESLTPVRVKGDCRLVGGSWYSVFDGKTTTDPSGFDVDHVVPLAEAWRSGANSWTDERREAFANDLTDERTLRAVSASSNRSKSDGDPAAWLPPAADFRCEYVRDWIAIKARWDLAVDPDEHDAIEETLADCDREGEVAAAAPAAKPRPAATLEPTEQAPKAAARPKQKARQGCHPSYPDVCIPAPPPDLDCGDIEPRQFEVKGADPHGFDGDGDGIGCES